MRIINFLWNPDSAPCVRDPDQYVPATAPLYALQKTGASTVCRDLVSVMLHET